MQEIPAKSMFAECLNSQFLLDRAGGEAVALELVELKDGYADQVSESYALRFQGPAAFVLPQQTYHLKHTALGEFDLFLVPVGRDGHGAMYEAVINHLRVVGPVRN